VKDYDLYTSNLTTQKINNMNPFENLTKKEYTAFLKFPVYISLLAANSDGKLDDSEKNAASKLSHTATFASDPILAEFYKDSDIDFENNLIQINKILPIGIENRKTVIKKELSKLEKILLKLSKENIEIMRHSMKLFEKHVSKSHNTVLMDFILPIKIQGLNE
jgi:hypothetical protein